VHLVLFGHADQARDRDHGHALREVLVQVEARELCYARDALAHERDELSSNAAIARGVKPWFTSRRSRVCSAPSRADIESSATLAKRARGSSGLCGRYPSHAVMFIVRRSSEISRSTSAKRVANHAVASPNGSA
jgi:hypothetical protein